MNTPAQIFMLPATEVGFDKFSIIKDVRDNKLQYSLSTERGESELSKIIIKDWKLQHIYVCSDDTIKGGDWYLRFGIVPVKCPDNRFSQNKKSIEDSYEARNRKIIASTDPSLNLPTPSKEFVKRFCQLNGYIKDILVEYQDSDNDYEEWTPDGMKTFYVQELKVNSDNTISIIEIKKPSFTREEVQNMFDTIFAFYVPDGNPDLFFNKIESYRNTIL